MRGSGQGLFLPRAALKQKDKMSAGHFLLYMAAIYLFVSDTFVSNIVEESLSRVETPIYEKSQAPA